MNFRRLLVLAIAGTCGLPFGAQAAEPLRLQQAIDRALSADPALRAENAELDAARARAERAALGTQYSVGGELENVAGTGSLQGFESAETTLRISRVLELGGKRAARQAVGEAETRLQENTASAARLDTMSRTATRFIEALLDQRRLTQADERVGLTGQTRREVAGWVEAGRNPATDLLAAELALAQAELEREHAEHELQAARMTLAASWGAGDVDFGELAGDLESLPVPASFGTLAARLQETPEQRDSELRAGALAAQRRAAVADARSDLTLSLGVRRLEALNDQGLVMSASLPLGGRRRSSLSVVEADARLTALDARREASLIERQQRLFERYQELNHARIEVQALREAMLPKAEEALALARRGFEAGRFSFIALAQAQDTLFELRRREVESAARYHTLLVEVDRLTATPRDVTP